MHSVGKIRIAGIIALYVSVFSGVVLFTCVYNSEALIVNLTGSMPYGFYVKTKKAAPDHGDIVNFHIERNEIIQAHCYGDSFVPRFYIKKVYGLPGEEIEKFSDHVMVAGKRLDLNDSVEAFVVSGTIPAGMLFVATSHPRSYDSRYFGLISMENVTGIYRPLWTFIGDSNG